ncbi:hypothetical protein Tco_0515173 [Tanacetum coccineum]
MGGQTHLRNYQYLGSPQKGLYPKVGCPICEGPRLDKDCPSTRKLNKLKRSDMENLDEQRLLTNNGGKFRVGPPGYYTKTDNRPFIW